MAMEILSASETALFITTPVSGNLGAANSVDPGIP